MKIAIIYNLNEHNAWYEADFDIPETIDAISNALGGLWEISLLQVTRDNYPTTISQLLKEWFDIVFNLTEGYPGESRESVWPILLEQFQIQYTGPWPKNLSLTLDKQLTKDVLYRKFSSLIIKDFKISPCDNIDSILVETILEKLKFPLFIKFNAEWSSLWIDSKSIVSNGNKLMEKIKELRRQFQFADILVEEFFDGIDLSVTYIEWLWVFWPVRYVYNNESNIYNYEMKIFDYNEAVDVQSFSDNYSEEVKNISENIVKYLWLEGYARIEFRISGNELRLIEINNQVCFLPEGAFVQAVSMSTGMTFKEIVWHILSYRLQNPIIYPLI